MESIKEGAVEIRFVDSKGKQKITVIIDFGKTDISPNKASAVFKSIVQTLRLGLGVKLSECK